MSNSILSKCELLDLTILETPELIARSIGCLDYLMKADVDCWEHRQGLEIVNEIQIVLLDRVTR
jgi:hypothetical protein